MQTRGPPRASGPRGAASSQASVPTALSEASGLQEGQLCGRVRVRVREAAFPLWCWAIFENQLPSRLKDY